MIPDRCRKRDLAVVDVREGSRVEYRLREGPSSCGCQRGTSGQVWTRGKARGFSLDPQWSNWYVEFVVRLRHFWCGGTHVTILTRIKIWPLQIVSWNTPRLTRQCTLSCWQYLTSLFPLLLDRKCNFSTANYFLAFSCFLIDKSSVSFLSKTFPIKSRIAMEYNQKKIPHRTEIGYEVQLKFENDS